MRNLTVLVIIQKNLDKNLSHRVLNWNLYYLRLHNSHYHLDKFCCYFFLTIISLFTLLIYVLPLICCAAVSFGLSIISFYLLTYRKSFNNINNNNRRKYTAHTAKYTPVRENKENINFSSHMNVPSVLLDHFPYVNKKKCVSVNVCGYICIHTL